MSTRLDEHGQPIAKFNWHNNFRKAMDSLYGLCAGLLADRKLTDDEIIFLDTWLKEHHEICTDFPANVIYRRVRDVLADGIITEDERADLYDTIGKMLGGTLEETGATDGLATRLPIDNVERIEIPGRRFCFTGKFVYGPRTKCERAVIELGGEVQNGITKKLDYLVIGTFASRDWAHTSHGRKIEKALDYKQKGKEILIISEEILVCHLE